MRDRLIMVLSISSLIFIMNSYDFSFPCIPVEMVVG